METPPRSPAIRRINDQLLNHMPWLDKISASLQKTTNRFFGEPGQSTYKIKDILNGVWLGHVIHPLLVAIPIGSWTATTFLDIVWLADQDEGVAKSADITMWLGIGGAVASATTGLTNWVDTDGPDQRTGILHALINSSALSLNLASAILRLTGQRRLAIMLALGAYGLVSYSGYLGGELAYSNGIGVNHVAWEGGSEDFVAIMDEAELEAGKLTRVDVDGIPAVLFKEGKAIYAMAATCSHLAGPLDEGRVENGVVYCPWHNSGFRLCDGSVSNSPAVYAQPTFDVRTRNSKIELRRRERA
jgi:nitrite reductase/ring-hydroxylating ferredoxin subunit/uncharacterized membrane protein